MQPNLVRQNALCRGGVVLLCSHLEGYIEELGVHVITRLAQVQLPKSAMSSSFRYQLSKDLIGDIQERRDPDRITEKIDELLRRDVHIWDSTSNFVHPLPTREFVDNFSTPRHDNIRRFFRRFGYEGFHSDLQKAVLAVH